MKLGHIGLDTQVLFDGEVGGSKIYGRPGSGSSDADWLNQVSKVLPRRISSQRRADSPMGGS